MQALLFIPQFAANHLGGLAAEEPTLHGRGLKICIIAFVFGGGLIGFYMCFS
jgi:hypothetical protein